MPVVNSCRTFALRRDKGTSRFSRSCQHKRYSMCFNSSDTSTNSATGSALPASNTSSSARLSTMWL